MKRQTITLLGLTAALVVCAAGYTVLTLTGTEEEESPGVALTAAADELTAASWQVGGTTLSFVKKDGAWQLEQDADFPVDGEKVATALAALAPLQAQPLAEQGQDAATYGITDESDAVTLTTAEGETVIRFGDDNPLGTGRYCAPDGGGVYLAATTALDALTTDTMDFIKMEEVPDMTDTVSWSIEANGATAKAVKKAQDEGSLDGFTWTNEAGEPLDTDSVESTLDYLTGLSYLRCAAYAPQDLAEYGLKTPQATVCVTYRDAEGQDAEMAWHLGVQTDDGFYAMPEGSDYVYVIDATLAQAVLDGAATDFSAKQPFQVAWDNAASISLETQDTKTEMEIVREISDKSESSTSTSSIEVSYTLDGEAADAAKAAQWLNDWNALTVTGQAETFDGEAWFTMTVTPLDGEAVVLEWAKTEEAAAVRQGNGVWKVVDMSAVQSLLEFWNANEQTTSESTS